MSTIWKVLLDPRFAKVLRIWVCPSVRTSIFYHSIFLRTGSLFFFIFCMKLRDHKYSKLTKPNFFFKFLLSRKNAKNCPKWPNLSICCFFLYFAWRWGTISNWRSRFFLGKFSLAQNQVKMSKMAQFVHLSVTTAFFSGLAHTLGRIWLAAFVFIYLCIARIFVTDTKSIYNTIQYNTQNWRSRFFWENFFLRKLLLAWKRAKMTQNALICLFVHYNQDSLRFHIFSRSGYF